MPSEPCLSKGGKDALQTYPSCVHLLLYAIQSKGCRRLQITISLCSPVGKKVNQQRGAKKPSFFHPRSPSPAAVAVPSSGFTSYFSLLSKLLCPQQKEPLGGKGRPRAAAFHKYTDTYLPLTSTAGCLQILQMAWKTHAPGNATHYPSRADRIFHHE